jgi:hypothetical protein
MTELQKIIDYAMEEKHGFIAEKNGKYVSGPWNESEYAQKRGWTILGSVVDLYKENF